MQLQNVSKMLRQGRLLGISGITFQPVGTFTPNTMFLTNYNMLPSLRRTIFPWQNDSNNVSANDVESGSCTGVLDSILLLVIPPARGYALLAQCSKCVSLCVQGYWFSKPLVFLNDTQ